MARNDLRLLLSSTLDARTALCVGGRDRQVSRFSDAHLVVDYLHCLSTHVRHQAEAAVQIQTFDDVATRT